MAGLDLFYQDPRDGELVPEGHFDSMESLAKHLGTLFHDAHLRSMRAFENGEPIELPISE